MSGDSNTHGDIFSTLEIDTIGEIMNISMGSAATAASTLLDNKVTITTPVVNVVPVEEFDIQQLEPAIAVEIQYVEGITGSNILILKKSDMRTILEQMMHTELPEDYEIDEMSTSAICELMNQMMGSSATVLSCFLGRNINISTPNTVPIEGLEKFKEDYFSNEESLLSIQFSLIMQDSIESVFVCAMKIGLAKEIIGVSLNFDDATQGLEEIAVPETEVTEPDAAADQPVPPAPTAVPQTPPAQQAQVAAPPVQGQPAAAPGAQPYAPQPGYDPAAAAQYAAPQQYAPQPGYPQQQAAAYPPAQAPYGYAPQPGYAPPYPQQAPVTVKDYNYGDFGQNGVGGGDQNLNLDLVMNVPVVMTVELGRTKRKIKEILEFGQGTIVELDKQAGSQVDVIVNGQLIARGDVVVVDDNFSIRITEIIKRQDPLSML